MNAVLLLSLLAAAPLLCSALPPLTCSPAQLSEAANAAVQHINQQHDHGYKFRLLETKESKMTGVVGRCTIEMQLKLGETECPFISPKPLDDCEYRGEESWSVLADCSVLLTVTEEDAKVTKHSCSMSKSPANGQEMMMICPDCPKLYKLDDEGGIKAVLAGVTQFNQNATHQNLYGLQDVGRISLGYVMTMGMMYYSEFVMTETRCPMGARIAPQACVALCPDRAKHAFCRLTYSSRDDRVVDLDCDFYPAKNFTPLGPGEEEPVCPSPRSSSGSSSYVVPCPGGEANADAAIHPICPYSAPQQ